MLRKLWRNISDALLVITAIQVVYAICVGGKDLVDYLKTRKTIH